MSTSSLRSVGEETRKGGAAVQASRRATAVRFAPPPLSSAAMSAKANSGSVSHSQQAMARPATASGARPGSAAGPRCRTSAGRLREPGPKATRRNWGWTGSVVAKEKGSSNPVAAKTHSRSSSAPRRLPPSEEKAKPQPKKGSKIMTASRTETNPATPPKTEMEGSRSPPDIARKNTKAPNCVSLKNMDMEVMGYRGDAEVAAVEALKEAFAAEILLRCLSAFAELTSAAAKYSPQETVDKFLALHTALTSSNAAVPATTSKASTQGIGCAPREEMRAWLLGHVERLHDGDVAGTLGQLKRMND
ncbi:hypothetical protein SETIT_8G043400v2 [Setaria italica]|uniref:DUF6857 domain-containing protein n=1 Tax=Setaria italica TaxID=4555 RepID=K3ZMJ7_SETIT|nr:hypothetical protein SETIT_8G043400v2 [Setaria italica]